MKSLEPPTAFIPDILIFGVLVFFVQLALGANRIEHSVSWPSGQLPDAACTSRSESARSIFRPAPESADQSSGVK